MNAMQLTLPEPPSSNRWWRNVNGRMVLSRQAREYKKALSQLAGLAVQNSAIRVSIDWYRGRKSGDLDKRLGVVLDALQGVLFENDAQIVELFARRFDDAHNARVVVTVEPVIPEPSPIAFRGMAPTCTAGSQHRGPAATHGIGEPE